MNLFNLLLTTLSLAAGLWLTFRLPGIYQPLGVILFTSFGLFALRASGPRISIVARLKSLRWKRNQFCRGWLITGDTGSGKTISGVNQLAH